MYFLQQLLATPDWENHVPEIIDQFVQKYRRPMLHFLLVLPISEMEEPSR